MTDNARFTIDGSPSEDGSGNRGFIATNGQTITLQLEANPSIALSVRYQVFDPSDTTSPLASKAAPSIVFVESGTPDVLFSVTTATASIILPGSGTHSYLFRCTVSTSDGPEVFERLVIIETTTTTPTLRKTFPAESVEGFARAWSDSINDMVDAIANGSGGATSPGGSDTQVQFNNAGAFGGDSNFTWTTGSTTLDITGDVNATQFNDVAITALGGGVLFLSDDGTYKTAALGTNSSIIWDPDVGPDTEFRASELVACVAALPDGYATVYMAEGAALGFTIGNGGGINFDDRIGLVNSNEPNTITFTDSTSFLEDPRFVESTVAPLEFQRSNAADTQGSIVLNRASQAVFLKRITFDSTATGNAPTLQFGGSETNAEVVLDNCTFEGDQVIAGGVIAPTIRFTGNETEFNAADLFSGFTGSNLQLWMDGEFGWTSTIVGGSFSGSVFFNKNAPRFAAGDPLLQGLLNDGTTSVNVVEHDAGGDEFLFNDVPLTATGPGSLFLADDGTYKDANAAVSIVADTIAHTGLLSKNGGQLTINAGDPTLFDISAGNGWIVDHADPNNVSRTEVSWSAFVGLSVDNLATEPQSNIAIDVTGSVVQIIAPNIPPDERNFIQLGILVHTAGVVVEQAFDMATPANNGILSFWDFINRVIGPANSEGNLYSANGATLQMNKTSGVSYVPGVNFHTDPKNPDLINDSAFSPAPIFRVIQAPGDPTSGIVIPPAPTNFIDPFNYDNGTGVLIPLPNPNNWTVQNIYWNASGGNTVVTYGQEFFTSFSDAQDALTLGTLIFTNPSALMGSSTLRTHLIVRRGATDLSNVSDAVFVTAPNFRLGTTFGGGGGGGGGGGDVFGPASAIDLGLAIYDGTTGKVIQDAAGPRVVGGNIVDSNVETLATTETNVSLSLAPDGAGGVTWLPSGMTIVEWDPDFVGSSLTIFATLQACVTAIPEGSGEIHLADRASSIFAVANAGVIDFESRISIVSWNRSRIIRIDDSTTALQDPRSIESYAGLLSITRADTADTLATVPITRDRGNGQPLLVRKLSLDSSAVGLAPTIDFLIDEDVINLTAVDCRFQDPVSIRAQLVTLNIRVVGNETNIVADNVVTGVSGGGTVIVFDGEFPWTHDILGAAMLGSSTFVKNPPRFTNGAPLLQGLLNDGTTSVDVVEHDFSSNEFLFNGVPLDATGGGSNFLADDGVYKPATGSNPGLVWNWSTDTTSSDPPTEIIKVNASVSQIRVSTDSPLIGALTPEMITNIQLGRMTLSNASGSIVHEFDVQESFFQSGTPDFWILNIARVSKNPDGGSNDFTNGETIHVRLPSGQSKGWLTYVAPHTATAVRAFTPAATLDLGAISGGGMSLNESIAFEFEVMRGVKGSTDADAMYDGSIHIEKYYLTVLRELVGGAFVMHGAADGPNVTTRDLQAYGTEEQLLVSLVNVQDITNLRASISGSVLTITCINLGHTGMRWRQVCRSSPFGGMTWL